MQDPLLFWTIVAAIGQAVGAVATAAAVSVSLWVVISERKPKLRARAGLRLIIPGDGTPATDAIGITISNVGMRVVRCTSIGWRTGWTTWGPAWLRRQLALQNPAYLPGSAQLPIDLEPGAEAMLILCPESYVAAVDAHERSALFNRQPPWRSAPTLTRVDLIVSMAAFPGTFERVEKPLAEFLATGVIQGGATKFNAAS